MYTRSIVYRDSRDNERSINNRDRGRAHDTNRSKIRRHIDGPIIFPTSKFTLFSRVLQLQLLACGLCLWKWTTLATLNSTHDFRISATILYCGTCIYTDTNVLPFQCSIIWPLLFNYQENFANCNFCISYHVYNSQLPKYLNRATIHSFQVLFKLFP